MRRIRPQRARRALSLKSVVGVCAIAGALFGAAPVAAYAAGVDSTYGTVASYYTTHASLVYSPGYAQAGSHVYDNFGSPHSAGFLGARGRLFTSGGSLSCEGGIWYNASGSSYTDGWSCGRYASGSWYSYGVVWVNGNAYYTFTTPTRST